MDKHYFETKKTARYFTHNMLSDQTETIIIAIHGYAQTAEHFIETFSSLPENYFVIAPEGLNRFYSRGFGGTPVANWMTSLERESEIKDYVNYLDGLYEHLQLQKYPKAKIVLLGFSQGVATSSRWAQYTQHKIDFYLMIAGDIANEMHVHLPDKIKVLPKAYLIGDNDSIIAIEKVEAMKLLFGSSTPFYSFEGKHEVNAECLKMLVKIVG
ncbi:MAG: alpha/beta hydrolase [Bacteroidota bacterium]|nr:alpha/beta hydrolase [Bacteroidota bacterium]